MGMAFIDWLTSSAGQAKISQLQSRRPAAVLSGLPQAIATPVARLERSMSGMITAEMAAIAPREVERLALIAPAFLRRRPGANSRAYRKFESSPLQRRESGANLSLARIRLRTSRSRGFPRVCGLGRAARSTETRKVQQHRAEER
jgi:pimeloyl-ACP methyl ester carboxylesterase